jgi:hypothetical protein
MVVFPEPDGPAMAAKSPFSIERVKPLIAGTSTFPAL